MIFAFSRKLKNAFSFQSYCKLTVVPVTASTIQDWHCAQLNNSTGNNTMYISLLRIRFSGSGFRTENIPALVPALPGFGSDPFPILCMPYCAKLFETEYILMQLQLQ
jgi:hypothetical protein